MSARSLRVATPLSVSTTRARQKARSSRNSVMKCRLLPLAVVACCGHGLAVAGPADYVFLPAVSYGERELDFKYGVSTKSDDPSPQAASLGFGYGATEFWFTEFYIKYEREGSHTAFDA